MEYDRAAKFSSNKPMTLFRYTLVLFFAFTATGAEQLKVLNYNVFNSHRHDKSYEAAVKWVNTVKPDIAGWQELVGWNEAKLKKLANDWHHPHAAALKSRRYNIGLTSS